MQTSKRKLVVMMTVENIQGREILSNLIALKFPVIAVIIEHKSKLAENTRNQSEKPHPKDGVLGGWRIPLYNYNISYPQHWGSFLLLMLWVDILPNYLLLLELIFWKLSIHYCPQDNDKILWHLQMSANQL